VLHDGSGETVRLRLKTTAQSDLKTSARTLRAPPLHKKYASTGGWGFAHFNDGKPADEAVHNTCFSCHQVVKSRDFVFNRYAP
jgi:Cytochrome P460